MLLPVPPLLRPPVHRVRALGLPPVRALMNLRELVSALNDFASPALAESWDNVGLLVEPSPPHTVKTLFLTNDLTEEVMEEAVQKKADLVLSYHPPIFTPLKRVTWKTWKERLVVRALENRIGIYSPHTAYDAIPHGVNNWLTKGLGACTSVPLHPSTAPSSPAEGTHRVEFCADAEHLDAVLFKIKDIPEISCLTTLPARVEGEEQTRVSLNCSQKALLEVVALLSQNSLLHHKTEILLLQKPPLPHTGMGRLCTLSEPASLSDIIERIKGHLQLPHVRVAVGTGRTLGTWACEPDCLLGRALQEHREHECVHYTGKLSSAESPVKKAALCAGSGSSVLKGTEADLYLTGEMSHHDVLDAVANGISVILCEHSNTERGFLSELRDALVIHLQNKINIIVSEKDRDPLQVA
ncbi:NIF3-like protein 1 isoform X1 [Corvus hawaiiensis]|uniref:NIF3-like protein 1 isoform X1 n=2 Tax=Corvus TaxID=30420 RepID=UPI001C04B879|nr:NIF3-like protein 1 isoform X1 [Corvus kubaryi]XP_041896814.1 NIF3-like protein 1 isoform X1 [Corvus kubaryi]XP_048165180.1 NIF3-like protein 1 isoform X1 [Corvus hawaiiensis]XP_048165181.1 NIF3-like protein 1 isoform X1 [Corvus hawaiiensis]